MPEHAPSDRVNGIGLLATAERSIPALVDICELSADLLEKTGIGTLNLICAHDLPGAETIEVGWMLDWMDEAARQVDLETRRHWYRFLDSPGTYNHSPGYFCCYFLLQVLQEDFGVKYNPARVRDPTFQNPRCIEPDFRDSRDLFIHGIIDGPGGTCASMPVIYAAVGRRLGYPLKLVETRGHLFLRWDDRLGTRFGFPERFNVDGAGCGIASHPDEYYRTWPEPWSELDKAGGWYLKSLSPGEEIAAFLSTRAECWIDNGQFGKAIQAYHWACRLAPHDARYRSQLNRLDEHRRLIRGRIDRQTTEIIRQNREQMERLSSLAANHKRSAVAPHGDYCQCLACKNARKAAHVTGFPGHVSGCQCFHCRQSHSSPAGTRRFQ